MRMTEEKKEDELKLVIVIPFFPSSPSGGGGEWSGVKLEWVTMTRENLSILCI